MGLTLIAFPIWYPVVEEGGLRWPRSGDLPLYAMMIAIGALIVWFVQRKG